MANKRLSTKATYVDRGYGQVEPNHLSAQRTGQIYAQLPADQNIDVLENGQFVKYDYKSGLVNFTGVGEWMLVFNEVKLYNEHLNTCDFALRKEDYFARVYSPIDGENVKTANSRNYKDVVAPADPYVPDSTATPFVIEQFKTPKMMPENTRMVPRVFKTNVGDIYTTNCIAEESVNLGDTLSPNTADGYLSKSGDGSIQWQVVKLYTMPDGQKGVKLMRIK